MILDSSISDVPWAIESKFEPNRPRRDLVRRERLLAQIHDGAAKKLALIIAPAGYGKSSLLGQWVEEAEARGFHYGWLTLESGEADEKQFLAYVVLLLSRAGLNLEELVTGARDGFGDAAIDAVLSKLIGILNDNNQRIVLILEDYHNAECEAVNRIIMRLIRDTLSNFTIFIDSRRQPNIDAVSLIASGEAVEIGASQLRLTKDETLTALGDVVNKCGGLEIYEQTEGWPVAVQLAIVQKRARPSEPILAGVDGGLIASYLTEQILSTLSPDAQELLLAVAFLERFNPELTNYVLDSDDAWSRIDSLSSFAALIVPLDVSTRWYRLHHLFAEYLREMQIRRNQSRANTILVRASQWHSEKKQIVEAVRYAARAGEYVKCERLILAAGGWKIILNDGIGVLRNALRLLPDDIIASSARLMIARAYLHCKYGEILEARAMLDAAIQFDDSDIPTLRDTDRLVVESMINLYEDRVEWTEDHLRLRKRYIEDDKLDVLAQGTMSCEDTLIHMSRGEFDTASVRLRDAFSFMRQSGSVLGLNYCYIHSAHIALYRGDFSVAAANIDRASKMADENFGSDSGLKAIASVLDYSLRAWRGECGAEDLDPFKNAFFHSIDNDGWVDVYITGLAAIVLLAKQCGDLNPASCAIQKLRLFAEQRNISRLKLFVDLSELSISAPIHDESPKQDQLTQFASSYSYNSSPRDWQSYLLSACLVGQKNRTGTSNHILTSAIGLAEEIDAGLWLFGLRLAKGVAYTKAEQADEAKLELLAAIKAAAPLSVIGPFLAEKAILSLISDIRSDLRHDESELITLQFVNKILERAKTLNPSKDSGVLSDREHEVLQKLACGLSNKEIARSLELTENTVKFHLKSIFSKLSVTKRTQAIIEGQRLGLID